MSRTTHSFSPIRLTVILTLLGATLLFGVATSDRPYRTFASPQQEPDGKVTHSVHGDNIPGFTSGRRLLRPQ